MLINPEDAWGPLLEQDRKKVNYYHGGHEGAMVSVFDRLKRRTLSLQTLARSKVSEGDDFRQRDSTLVHDDDDDDDDGE